MKVGRSCDYKGLSAEGGGILCVSDMDSWKNDTSLSDPMGVTFEIGEGITEVEKGFFDVIPAIMRIIFPASLKKLHMSDSTAELFRRNGVIICGAFDTYAESFAKEYGLRFIHSDILLTRTGSYNEPGGADVVTLRFMADGRVLLRQENFCPGISAGNNGGGEVTDELKANFYKTMSQEDIADMCRGRCCSKVRNNKQLAKFLKKARQKNGFCFSFAGGKGH